MDVLGAASNADDIAWWENGNSWAETTIDANFDGARSVYAADVDGDGDIDVLGAAQDDDDITLWKNANGAGTSWSEITIDANFDGAFSVHAADVDGDGDLDVLGAAIYGDDITWWENTAGDGSIWSETTIDANFDGTTSVYATDVDGDGDLDVLGAAVVDDDIAWWENGNSWAETTIDGYFDGASSVYAADVDGDGDLDVLGAAYEADDIAWWENIGGSAGYTVADTAPIELGNSDKDDLLKLKVEHNGISGDNDLEINKWNILFEETDADPLTTTEANNIIENLYVYLDDGDGGYDAEDTLVITVASLSLTDGVQTIIFADGDGNLQITQAAGSKTYFVVVEMTSNAESQGIASLRVTFDPDADTLNEDRTEDTSVSVADSVETNTGDIPIPEFPFMAVPVAGMAAMFGLARRRRWPRGSRTSP